MKDAGVVDGTLLCPAFLVVLRVAENIGGDGDDREYNAESKLQKTASFVGVKPLNVYQSTQTYLLFAGFILPK